jgi:hypothetical protein
MSSPVISCLDTMHSLLCSQRGIQAQLADLQKASGTPATIVKPEQVVRGYVQPDKLKTGDAGRYPLFQLYCDKIENQMREKFVAFSGTVFLTIEIQVSHEHAQNLTAALHQYTDAVTKTIEDSRGNLASGTFLSGRYTVTFDPPKSGGLRFVQIARVSCPVEISRA